MKELHEKRQKAKDKVNKWNQKVGRPFFNAIDLSCSRKVELAPKSEGLANT
jgi:hypothetical protein